MKTDKKFYKAGKLGEDNYIETRGPAHTCSMVESIVKGFYVCRGNCGNVHKEEKK